MMDKPDYAFPLDTDFRSQNGMTLRDYFAGQALVAASLDDPDGESYTPKQHAEWAYSIADAMLEARKTKEVAE